MSRTSFLAAWENGNIVMLALGSFLSEVSSKGWIPMANVLGGVENSKRRYLEPRFSIWA
jgi:hypothetical protein